MAEGSSRTVCNTPQNVFKMSTWIAAIIPTKEFGITASTLEILPGHECKKVGAGNCHQTSPKPVRQQRVYMELPSG